METKEELREDVIEESLKVREGNISLVLDSYDDLFSDFDPRPYASRGLSDDFIFECKKAVRDKGGITELRLLIPANKRNMREEGIIKKRLKEHFKKHFREEHKIIKRIKREGLLWFFIGSIILVISTFLFEFKGNLTNTYLRVFFDFLFIISQPAGWFTFWEGLGKIFIVAREESPDYEFYKKMMDCNVYFLNY
ncbi:Uncharacterised protein [uncultured archaeon]|nr:Uncharacterised protein [uncultured archaeon]